MAAVIFDMDGLMFDTERVFVQAWDYAGEQLGIGKAGYMTLKTLWMNIAASRELWRQEFGERYDEEALRRYTKEFLTKYYTENKVPVKHGLYVLLRYLKIHGYQLAVASSSPQWEVEHHLKDAGVYEFFTVIVCGDMVKHSKPDPEIYKRACELLGEKPEDCYVLEDSKSGLRSAHAAGCKPIMIPDLWQPDEETTQLLFARFDNLVEVKEYLEEQEVMTNDEN